MNLGEFLVLCLVGLLIVAVIVFIRLGGFCWLFNDVLHSTKVFCDASSVGAILASL